MIVASSVASECSPCNLKNVLRVESVRHRKDEEYERFIVAVPFHTPPQWGAVVSIVSALLVAGKAGEGRLRQREVRRLAPNSSARHHCKPCITTQSFNIFLYSCRIRVCIFRLRMAMTVGNRLIRSLDARTLDSWDYKYKAMLQSTSWLVRPLIVRIGACDYCEIIMRVVMYAKGVGTSNQDRRM